MNNSLTKNERIKRFVETETEILIGTNIHHVREIYWKIKDYIIGDVFRYLELYDFEKFIIENSNFFKVTELDYTTTSEEEDNDDY